eukprot:c18506_g1_i5.p1 GENE.c18506_g1_i5~~c18506_g1_i5.p1  ORF type:complete len:175 (+),score=19.39 c18506_g1_i5:72-596(+)
MGVQSWMIFLSDLIPFIPWVCADFPVRFSVALNVMDGKFQGRIAPLIALNVIAFSMGNAIGVLCAVCVDSSRELMQLLYGIFFFMYLPSGCIWPIESQPRIMYMIAQANPLMWLVRAFRAIFMRNVPLWHRDVLVALVFAPTVGVIAFTLAGISMSYHTPIWDRLKLWRRRLCR